MRPRATVCDSSGAGTRTPDTRIMIPLAREKQASLRQATLSSWGLLVGAGLRGARSELNAVEHILQDRPIPEDVLVVVEARVEDATFPVTPDSAVRRLPPTDILTADGQFVASVEGLRIHRVKRGYSRAAGNATRTRRCPARIRKAFRGKRLTAAGESTRQKTSSDLTRVGM